VRTTDISDGGIEWATVPFCEVAPKDFQKYAITPNDILVSRAGSVGVSIRVLNVPCDAVFASYLIRFKPSNGVSPEYVSFFLKSDDYWRSISEFAAGIAVPNVNASKLRSLELPLAPFEEQRRIVAKLETLFSKVDDCKVRLARIPTFIRRFRQSVLAAACSGRLTADWRRQINGAPAPGDNDAEADDLPLEWNAVCVGDVIDDLKYGTSQKCGYEKHGVSVLRIPNVAKGVIDHEDMKYAVLSAKEQKQLHLLPGDILIVRSNGSVSLVGKCALVGEKERGYSYAGYLIRIRPNQTIVSAEFLNLALSSYNVRLQIELEARSTSGVNNINSEEVRALRLSLPPLDEQEEIVQRVKGLFALADKIESRYQGVQQQVDRLPQSILTKAFRGELVPTEAELAGREGRSYESAEQLLQRIQAAKAEPVAMRGNGHRRARRRTG
jgi:type I restriction enzyme S subunit